MNGWSWLMLCSFLNRFKQARAGLSEPPVPVPLAKWPQASTSSSQPRFKAWLWPGIPKPSTSSSYLRLLYSSGRTQVVPNLGLHHPGNSTACAPSWQLQTMSEHYHPALAWLILQGGQRLVISGHRQSLQRTGCGKSLPLTCQQQQTLNYKGGYTQPTQRAHLE